MAYAFNKVDDYFRKGKTGALGNSLQKGTEGAPAPTAAANTLAKTAETSAEQGNADTNAFRAAKESNTAAIQSSLQQPTQRQAASWGETEQAKANEFLSGGQKKISETYKPLDQANIGKAESGDTAATNQLTQQLNYKPMEFSPYSVQQPAFDQQQLAGGVGGLQAALQKQRGGRYSQGMAALDASVLAGNRGAMQGLQQGLGDIYQGAREKQATLEQTDENLAAQAKTKSEETSKAVREALQARLPALQQAQAETAQQEAQKQAQAEAAAMQPQAREALRQALLGQGLTQADVDRMGSQEFLNDYGRFNPTMGLTQEFMPEDMSSLITQSGPMASYTSSSIDPRYQNLANILSMGGTQTKAAPSTVQYQQYGVARPAVDQLAANLSGQYRGVNQRLTQEQFEAANQPINQGAAGQVWDPMTGKFGPLGGVVSTIQEQSDPNQFGTTASNVTTLGGILPTPQDAWDSVFG